MKPLHKLRFIALTGAVLIMTVGIAHADKPRSNVEEPGSATASDDQEQHRHPYGPPGKGPRRYQEHGAEQQPQTDSSARTPRRGPPGKTPFKARKTKPQDPSTETGVR